MKTAKRKPARRESLYMEFSSSPVIRALTRMTVAFPFVGASRTRLWYLRKEKMAQLLVRLALAHIEVLAPRLRAMIDYCEAEEMDQTEYLESLIRAKFAKNLHFGPDDDDDDDEGSAVTSMPLMPATSK